MLRFFCGLVAVCSIVGSANGQNRLVADAIERFQPVWWYHEGDDSLWAHPDYPEQGWEAVASTKFVPGKLPERGWTGIGWFRAHVEIDESLVGTPLAFAVSLQGTAEFYLDGTLVASYGRVGTSEHNELAVLHQGASVRPNVLVFGSEGKHVLAVRVSNFVLRDSHKIGHPIAGFGLRFADASEIAATSHQIVRSITAQQYLFAGIQATFAVIFLLLFVFHRIQLAHLYFAVFCILGASVVWIDLQAGMTSTAELFIVLRQLLNVVLTLMLILAMWTTYALLQVKTPIHFWGLAVIGLGVAIWGWLDPFTSFRYTSIFSLVAIMELVRSAAWALVKKKPGAWLLSIGLLCLILGVAYDNLMDLGLIFPIGDVTNGYYYGLVALDVSMAVILALAFARTNRQLERKLVEVEKLSEQAIQAEREARKRDTERIRLEADNEKKALQLEKAQKLRASYEALEAAHEDLKATQASLVHSEKMASLGKLVAGIAHEIKNPLNFINNFAGVSVEMALELKDYFLSTGKATDSNEVEITETILGNVRRIGEHGKRADGIVRSMMQHASASTGERRRVDLNALIDNYLRLSYRSLRLVEGEFEVQIERDFDEEVGMQEVDPETFGRALVNVLDNAFEAALIGRDEPGHVPFVSVSTTKLDTAVLIRIRDNGPGVHADMREQIFEPFFTTKPTGEGTGLGLSLAHEIIVEGHSGTFGIEHLDDSETGFYITLPAMSDPEDDTLSDDWPV